MARSLKGYRKIIVNNEEWYWKFSYGYYIWLYLYSKELNRMKRMYCDNHYHKEDGTIVDSVLTPSIVSYIISNNITEITSEIIKEHWKTKIRMKKLDRILKK
jgi:hypothetical protein